jgi:4-hydroxy-2-oxoheptanedioate aldolase
LSYDINSSGAALAGMTLSEIISERRVAHGGWCMLPSAFATEIVSASGCDWLCIDQQHGLIDDASMRAMVQAAAIRATPVVVRVPWNEPAGIMRALDAGADGVIVPMTNTVEEARRAVEASRYPPLGYRSWGPLRSSMAIPGFNPQRGNERSVCMVMIETAEAYENLDAILEVPGVDSVMVGPNDLCISHSGSNAGSATSEPNVSMIRGIAEACARHGVSAGISCGSGEEARRWQSFGYTLLGMPSDAGLLGDGMAAVLASARSGGDTE